MKEIAGNGEVNEQFSAEGVYGIILFDALDS